MSRLPWTSFFLLIIGGCCAWLSLCGLHDSGVIAEEGRPASKARGSNGAKPAAAPQNELPSRRTLRGKVVDAVTGQSAANVEVVIQATKQSTVKTDVSQEVHTTTTNADGEYQFTVMPTIEYNIWATAAERTCAALNSVPMLMEETTAENLELVEGGWIEGRVLTIRGEHVSHDPESGERLTVGLNGPSRPRSGASFETCSVGDEGEFRIRVPAGRNFPYLLSDAVWQKVWRVDRIERGISVESGKTTTVTLRLREKNVNQPRPPHPARDPVRLPPPVADERDAAETLRDLGGWYELDEEGHVTQINMVYHEAGKVRYDNPQTNSDQALRIAAAFPRLKHLLLKERQATNESMVCLADLEGLLEFFVWDAVGITDEGARHLAHLKNLTNIHLSKGGIGDETLQVLATLPELNSLSLQQNNFSDAGLAHLSKMKQLRSLWIGRSKGQITDQGLVHLEGLDELGELDIHRSQITDAGLESIAKMKGLHLLCLSNAKVTPEGKAKLKEARPNLVIH